MINRFSRIRGKRNLGCLLFWGLLTALQIMWLIGSAVTTARDQHWHDHQSSAAGALVNNCCSMVHNYEAQKLSECVRDVLIDWNHSYPSNNIPQALQRQGPTLIVTIISRSTPNINEYASYTHFSQAYFALHNNYRMQPILQPDTPISDYMYYRKLAPLIETLKGSAIDTDYLVWMDADLIVLDIDFRIEQLAAAHPSAHILMSADVSSIANSGCIIVKNSQWAIKFLTDWWKLHEGDKGLMTDQLGFEALYKLRPVLEMEKRIALLPPDVLNSDAPPMGRQLPHHKILHLAAESLEMRRDVFHAAASRLCSSAAIDSVDRSTRMPQLTNQLGITRQFLQETAQTVYMRSTSQLLHEISAPLSLLDLDVINSYRQSFSKLSHAIRYVTKGEQETALTSFIRAISLLSVCMLLEGNLRVIGYYDYNMSNRLQSQKQFRKLTQFHESSLLFKISKVLRLLEEKNNAFLCQCIPADQPLCLPGEESSCGDISYPMLESCDKYLSIKEDCRVESHGLLVIKGASAELRDMIQKSLTASEKLKSMRNKFLNIYSRDNVSDTLKKACEGQSGHSQIVCMNSQVNRLSEDLPELLKIVAEISFENMQTLQEDTEATTSLQDSHADSLNDRVTRLLPNDVSKSIGNYTMSVLSLLSDIVSPQQRHLIQDMKAGLLTQFGQIYLSESPPKLDKALESLLESRDLHENVLQNSISDRRSYLYTLALLAKSHCINKEYEKGIALYEQSIRLESEHVGEKHHNLVHKYANGGICAAEAGETENAKSWLRKALEIIDRHESIEFNWESRDKIEAMLRSL